MEDWKPVDGYDGYYEVSDSGKIRSVRYDHTGRLTYYNVLKPSVQKS